MELLIDQDVESEQLEARIAVWHEHVEAVVDEGLTRENRLDYQVVHLRYHKVCVDALSLHVGYELCKLPFFGRVAASLAEKARVGKMTTNFLFLAGVVELVDLRGEAYKPVLEAINT